MECLTSVFTFFTHCAFPTVQEEIRIFDDGVCASQVQALLQIIAPRHGDLHARLAFAFSRAWPVVRPAIFQFPCAAMPLLGARGRTVLEWFCSYASYR